MTSLSATIGTGNIAGVATAIFLGGPGAVFWMWMTALVGMATKYAEAVCAVRLSRGPTSAASMSADRCTTSRTASASTVGLAGCLPLRCSRASPVSASAIWFRPTRWRMPLNSPAFGMPTVAYGRGILVVLVGAVLLGGIERIAMVAGKLVPSDGCSHISAAGSCWSLSPMSQSNYRLPSG